MKKTSPAFLKEGGAVTSREAVEKARQCLENVTPMESDCGELCAAACCCSLEGEETGMLLFPGEEEAYLHMEGWKVLPGAAGNVVVCPGRCNRSNRPLSCRIFPLLPVVRNGEIRAAMDQRAAAVCPLAAYGVKGLSEAFREGVREAGRLLMESDATRQMLEEMTRRQDELKALRAAFGAK